MKWVLAGLLRNGLKSKSQKIKKGTDMTREEAISRWTGIAQTIFWAEDSIAKKWRPRLREAYKLSKEERHELAMEYCRAVAIEIVSATSDEELEKMEE